jgi:glycosyltransferase involved in cell wall biosynthesis
MPTVSVIIPAYNVSSLIEGCIESVRSQTLNDIEIVVVDGDSQDETAMIARGYALHDSRVKVYSARDKGVYDAMNKGIERSTGRWLMFLGADDRLYQPDLLERLSPVLATDLEIVYGDVFHVKRQQRVGGAFTAERLMIENICHQGMLFSRPLLKKVGAFNLRFPIAADWDLNLRCFASGARANYVPLIFSSYAGSGLSSITIDATFEACRLNLAAEYWGISVWNRGMTHCRFAFRSRALACLSTRDYPNAVRCYLIFIWHSLNARYRRGGSESLTTSP